MMLRVLTVDRAGFEKLPRNPTPRSFCVNAVDKGFSGEIGVKAVDKGLSSRIGVSLDLVGQKCCR
jgi:hypothetical protein